MQGTKSTVSQLVTLASLFYSTCVRGCTCFERYMCMQVYICGRSQGFARKGENVSETRIKNKNKYFLILLFYFLFY